MSWNENKREKKFLVAAIFEQMPNNKVYFLS